MKKVRVLNNSAEEFRLMEACIRQKAAERSPLQILEAGCGRRWPLNLSGVAHTLTGVDLDKAALEIRKTKVQDLDEVIVGDLRTVCLKENWYDVIYNSFVLEHVQNAEQILENFTRWQRPGGVLILRIPDRDSVYGFFTRITPFWFHVFYKRHIMGLVNAGKPGFGPYPTYHERVISRDGVREFCRRNHYTIKEEVGQAYYLNKKGIVSVLLLLFVVTVALLSFGRLKWKYNNLTFILEKQEAPALVQT